MATICRDPGTGGCKAEASAGMEEQNVEETEKEARHRVRKRERERKQEREMGRERRAAKHCSDPEATPRERRQTGALCLALALARAHSCARSMAIIQRYGAPSSGGAW